MWLWPQARGDRKRVGGLREKGPRNRRTGPGGSHLAAGSPKWGKAAVPTAGDPLEQNPRYPQRGQGPSGTPELQALTRCGAPCQTLPVGCGFCYSTACPSSTLPPGGAREQAPPSSQGRKPPRWCCFPVPSLELSHSASRQPLPAMAFTHQPSPALVVSPAPLPVSLCAPHWNPAHIAHGSLFLVPGFADSVPGHLLQKALRVLSTLPPASWVFLPRLGSYHSFTVFSLPLFAFPAGRVTWRWDCDSAQAEPLPWGLGVSGQWLLTFGKAQGCATSFASSRAPL